MRPICPAYLAAHPAAAIELLRMVVGRLRSADRRRIEFGGFETTSRLAHLLAELADEDGTGTAERGIEIPFSQDELAAMVGASRESVARGWPACGPAGWSRPAAVASR